MAKAFATFKINQHVFALEALLVQEVVNVVDELTFIPGSPDYFVGMFNLRGQVIPVLRSDLLLGRVSEKSMTASNKIVVVRFENIRLGLNIDDVGELFRCEDDQIVEVDHSAKGVVSGVVIRNDLTIPIINIKSLSDLEFPRVHQLGNLEKGTQQLRAQRQQYISFRINDSICAIELSKVVSVAIPPSTDEDSAATKVILVRGVIVPIVKLKDIISHGDASSETEHDGRLVVVTVEGLLIAIEVDGLRDIFTIAQSEIRLSPALGRANAEVFSGSILRHGELNFILDLERLLRDVSDFQRAKAYALTANISISQKLKEKAVKKLRTYIVVTIGGQVAIPIDSVSGVLECPKEMQRPPGLSKHVMGIFSQRGTSVAVIDTSTIYDISKEHAEDTKKLVIFDLNGSRYGITVDMVNVVIRAYDEDNLDISKTLYTNTPRSLAKDCPYAVTTSSSSGKQTLFVMDLSKTVERLIAA